MTKTRITLTAALFAVLAYAPVSHAYRIEEGTLEIGGSVNMDFISGYNANFNADLGTGYYIRNGVMLGGKVQGAAMKDYAMFGAFVTIEQNLEFDTPFVPYFGADLGGVIVDLKDLPYGQGGRYTFPDVDLASADSEKHEGTRAAFVGAFRIGCKYYLTEMAAIDTSMSFYLASDRIYARRDTSPASGNAVFRIGLRYCLF